MFRKLGLAMGIAASLAFVSAPVSAADGAKLFKRCKACHTLTGKNKVGPTLKGVFGRKCGTITSFKYGKGYKMACKQTPFVIDEAFLMEYLINPSKKLTKMVGQKVRSKMNFKLKKKDQRAAIVAYLKSQ